MMRQYRLMWDFMLTVIGDKYRKSDSSFGKIDLNVFFMQLQEHSVEPISKTTNAFSRTKCDLSRKIPFSLLKVWYYVKYGREL